MTCRSRHQGHEFLRPNVGHFDLCLNGCGHLVVSWQHNLSTGTSLSQTQRQRKMTTGHPGPPIVTTLLIVSSLLASSVCAAGVRVHRTVRVPYQGYFSHTCHSQLSALSMPASLQYHVFALRLYRQPLCAQGRLPQQLLVAVSRTSLSPAFLSSKVPEHWRVELSGQGDNRTQIPLKVKVTVQPARYDDSGYLLCQVFSRDMYRTTRLTMAADYVQVGWGEKLLSRPTIRQNETFRIKCRLTSFPMPPHTISLRSLTLTFRPGSGACVLPEVKLARYEWSKNGQVRFSRSPDWTFVEEKSDQPLIPCGSHIELWVRSADVSTHVGLYTCTLGFTWSHLSSYSDVINTSIQERLISDAILPMLQQPEWGSPGLLRVTCGPGQVSSDPDLPQVSYVQLDKCGPCACTSLGHFQPAVNVTKSGLAKSGTDQSMQVTVGLNLSSPTASQDLTHFRCTVGFRCPSPWTQPQEDLSRDEKLQLSANQDMVQMTMTSMLMVRCDSDTLPVISDLRSLTSLEILRKVTGETEWSLLVKHQPGNNTVQVKFPAGRDWLLGSPSDQHGQSAQAGQRMGSRLTIIIRDVRCQDAGQYMCRLVVRCPAGNDQRRGELSQSQSINLSEHQVCLDKPAQIKLTSSQDQSDKQHSWPLVILMVVPAVVTMLLAVICLMNLGWEERPAAGSFTTFAPAP